MTFKSVLTAILALSAGVSAHAFNVGGDNGVAFHGSVQSDILFPEEDDAIGTKYDSNSKLLTNTYADLNMISKYVDAGARLEFMKWPLPGFEPDFKGWGVPHIYAKGRYKGFELTAGDFYEQFGNGFILRTYQERSLGIDNSIRGGRLKVSALKGFNFTALAGLQRRYWDWKKESKVYGANVDVNLEELSAKLTDQGIGWTVGASYVLKDEDTDDAIIMVPGTDKQLNLPRKVGAYDLRSQFSKGDFSVLGEWAWKSQDPSADNGYTYGHGTAAMISGTYTRPGLSAIVQAKRSENMAFRSQRAMTGTSVFLNNMPAFAYQHTYSLAALYPYATQAAPGEWAFQGSLAYSFKRKTPLGGKYGTKVTFNASVINGLKGDSIVPNRIEASNGILVPTVLGTDGRKTSWFGQGDAYYRDFNVQIDKKLTRDVQLSFMYMYQLYNQKVIEGHNGDVKSNIFVVDTKAKLTKKLTLRTELQYLQTRDDQKDWAYGMVELSVAPYLMFTVSDMWNCGGNGTHYYMGGVAGTYGANRLMLSYGRTRAGFNCSGGVCRYVPASRGFQVAYNYTF